MTQGPLGEVDSVNLYAFNRFDSVNFIDPFGLKTTGPANGETTVICREPDGFTCGPNGRAAREALKAEQDSQRRNQAPATALATAFVGMARAESLGGIGATGARGVPKHPIAVAVAVGVGVGVLACKAGVDAQCQSNLQGIETEAGRLKDALEKKAIREVAAIIAAIAEASEEGDGPAPVAPEDAPNSDWKNEPLDPFWDLDDAAAEVFGAGAKVVPGADASDEEKERAEALGESGVEPSDRLGEVKNTGVRDKMRELGYDPDEYEANVYDVQTADGRGEQMTVFEPRKSIKDRDQMPAFGPHRHQ